MRALIAALFLSFQGGPAKPAAPLVVWHVDGAGHGRPAIDGGSVYFLSNRHEVVALDATKGTERWRQNTNEPGAATEGSAIVIAGPVIVAVDYNLLGLRPLTRRVRCQVLPLHRF